MTAAAVFFPKERTGVETAVISSCAANTKYKIPTAKLNIESTVSQFCAMCGGLSGPNFLTKVRKRLHGAWPSRFSVRPLRLSAAPPPPFSLRP